MEKTHVAQHSTAQHSKCTLLNAGLIIFLIFMWSCLQQTARADKVEKMGDILQVIIPMVGLGSTIFYEIGNEGSIQFLKSLAISQITTELLKVATHKRRPNGNCCKSFPSGHTSSAFMGAGFIHRRYGGRISIPAYLGATYVAYSRVHADKHHVEDIVAGAAIGILSSFYFTDTYKDFSITPLANNGTYGLGIFKQW